MALLRRLLDGDRIPRSRKLAIGGPIACGGRSRAARVDVRPAAVPLRSVPSLELENAGRKPVTLRLLALDGGRAVRVRIAP